MSEDGEYSVARRGRGRAALFALVVASFFLVGGVASAAAVPVEPVAVLETSSNAHVLPHQSGFRLIGKHAYVDVDFGREVVGDVVLATSTGTGAAVDVALTEGRVFLGFRSDFPGDAGRTVGEATHACGMSTVCSHFGAFRYARIFLARSTTVEISAVHAVDQSQAAPARGSFAASDAELTRIWESSARTLSAVVARFNAAQSDYRGCGDRWLAGRLVLLDGAKRDRCPYIADLAVSGLSELIRSGDAAPVTNVLLGLARLQRTSGFMPGSFIHLDLPFIDYPAWWAVVLYDDVLYSGDRALARRLWPNLVQVLDRWYPSLVGSDGLIRDPSPGTDYAFVRRTGTVVTYYNALLVLALKDSGRLARWIGHDDRADAWTARARTLSERINKLLWDPGQGAYFDAAGSSAAHPLDGNALALVSGTPTSAMAREVFAFIGRRLTRPWGTVMVDSSALDSGGGSFPTLTLLAGAIVMIGLAAFARRRYRRLPRALPLTLGVLGVLLGALAAVGSLVSTPPLGFSERVYPFMSYFELEGRFETGGAAGALGEIRRTWGPMTSDPGAPGTTWEYTDKDADLSRLGPHTSLAHGWSTGALPLLTNDVLGVRPLTPGFSHFGVAPAVVGLSWVHGTIPTPRGVISVSWKVMKRGFTLTIQAPHGETAEVALPRHVGASRVTFDGARCGTSPRCTIEDSA